ncbi:MAG: aspartate ammonia-lyase [Erysipelothrix sp.]|nr:aspartate ammonia-lyase [Erysipelothrix sp.]
MTDKFRIEVDSIGEYTVPVSAYYGSQTARSLNNFNITGQRIPQQMIKSLGMTKKACAIANNRLGHLDDERFKYIKAACDEVIAGQFDDDFVTDMIQGGAGTSVNMNANEVIANRASQLAGYPLGEYGFIHPNDHINYSQSTNDVYPTAGKLTAIYLIDDLLAEIKLLRHTLLKKAEEFDDVIKLGRTHLQDAVPIRLSQEFHAYASAFSRDFNRIQESFQALRAINLGATAVGTGLNADENFRYLSVSTLSDISGIDVISVVDLVDGTRNVDPLVWAHSSLNTFATSLSKMSSDFRLMASGPKAGLGEIRLPEMQPGSSIMPGKVNPVILEVTNQVCFQVFGNQVTITKAAEAGQLELNVFEPVLFYNLFQSIQILTNVCETLRVNCIDGIEANRERCEELVEISSAPATALAPHIGYKKASELAKEAMRENKKMRELILEKEIMSESELDEVLDLMKMTHPGIPGRRHK